MPYKTRARLKIGDYVRTQNARGTVWEYGKIEAFVRTPNGRKALLSYGAPGIPQWWRLWGAGIPENLDDLEPIHTEEA